MLGQSFTAAGLAGLGERSTIEWRAAARGGLVAKQILSLDDDRCSSERGQYRFLQALLRTIAYGTLARRDRKARTSQRPATSSRPGASEAASIAEVLATH